MALRCPGLAVREQAISHLTLRSFSNGPSSLLVMAGLVPVMTMEGKAPWRMRRFPKAKSAADDAAALRVRSEPKAQRWKAGDAANGIS